MTTAQEDVQGQINALRDALCALGQLLPQEQRNQFHMNMQRLNPPTQSPGYMDVRGYIVRHTR